MLVVHKKLAIKLHKFI